MKNSKSICLFNHKGGVSKTTTAFNLAWGLAELGHRVLMIDLDSQCNLSGLVLGYEFIDDEKIATFYESRENLTMRPIVEALINGITPEVFVNSDRGKLKSCGHEKLFLLPGHLDVSDLDSQISVALKIATGIPATRNIPGNLPEVIKKIAAHHDMDYIIYDLSPNVGGLNEVMLMSSDYFIVPTSPDFFCLQAIWSLEKNIIKWHREIKRFKEENGFLSRSYPIANSPKFIGAVQQRYRPRNEKPAKSFEAWIARIREAICTQFVPSLEKINCAVNREIFLKSATHETLLPYDLAHIPDFNSLIAISQNLSKPIFALSDDEIKNVGQVFGHAHKTMIESRDKFNKIFSELALRVQNLTT